MSNQKTLLVTSIYSDLWGTEFGGRPSRGIHYKLSLSSIMKMNPTKVICYTSQEELSFLEDHFYSGEGFNSNQLQFKVFDLKDTKYFQKIYEKKDLEFMKRTDRCFEIQYNKFFWTDTIEEIYEYDRVFWFDAGLSHGGLFPEQFAIGNGFEKHFRFNVFNESFLQRLNVLTEEKFVIIEKNNSGRFFWSQTVPEIYFKNYSNLSHVVGGFFGGTPTMFKKIIKDFENLLINLLDNESQLYMEEQLLTCLYRNNMEEFVPLKFDDWYRRESHDDSVKLFYQIFTD